MDECVPQTASDLHAPLLRPWKHSQVACLLFFAAVCVLYGCAEWQHARAQGVERLRCEGGPHRVRALDAGRAPRLRR